MFAFRTGTESDVDAIVAVVNRAYSPEPGAPGWTGERSFQPGDRTDAREVRALLSSPQTSIIVGVRDGVVVTCCSVTSRDETTAYLGMFAVDPERQGGGSGRATMAWAESFARIEIGAAQVVIEVMEHHEPLRQWYERQGYQPTGARKPFPNSMAADRVHLIEMIKALDVPSGA